VTDRARIGGIDLASLLRAPHVTPADGPQLAAAYKTVTGPARYWRSPSYLASDKANRLACVEGSLLLLRVKVLHGNPVAYLLVPPMGPDVGTEHAVLRACLAVGVGARLSRHDMARYDVTGSLLRGQEEYVCRGPAPPGRAARALHRGHNLLTRRAASGDILLRSTDRLERGLLAPALTLAARWRQQRGVGRGVANVITAHTDAAGGRQHAHAVVNSATGQVIALSLSEAIGRQHAARVCAITDYTDPLAKQLAEGLHEADCRWWGARDVSIGAAVRGPGLTAHKHHLCPRQSVPLHHAAPAVRLTLDAYRDATADDHQLSLETQ
jgi:hypothetical protein